MDYQNGPVAPLDQTLLDPVSTFSSIEADSASAKMEPASEITIASNTIVIPLICVGLIVFMLIGFLMWQCVSKHLEKLAEERDARLEERKKSIDELAVPIAEEEDFTPAPKPKEDNEATEAGAGDSPV